ncbi:hypothetical protein P9112_002584 [Eukaryota sp. TZLM1-RC]
MPPKFVTLQDLASLAESNKLRSASATPESSIKRTSSTTSTEEPRKKPLVKARKPGDVLPPKPSPTPTPKSPSPPRRKIPTKLFNLNLVGSPDRDEVELSSPTRQRKTIKPIAVFCRLKPYPDQSPIELDDATDSIIMKIPRTNTQQGVNNTKETWSFPFTRVFTKDNLAIFKEVAVPSISALFANKSTTIMNHGGSGAGKSYTLFGSPLENTTETMGLIPRCLKCIFNNLSDDQEVHLSYFEVHGEGVSDLLSIEENNRGEKSPVQLNTSLVMSASANQQISIIPGLRQVKVDDLRDAMVKLARGTEFRTIRKTKSNMLSTRGHGIFSIHLVSRQLQTHSKLVLVDLAAFDKESGKNSPFFNESVKINKSLFFLEGVLNAITSKKTHIPYRNCLFTSVLRFILQYCPRIQMIANLSLNPKDVHDSLNTCLFFRRIGLIRGQKFQGDTDPMLEKLGDTEESELESEGEQEKTKEKEPKNGHLQKVSQPEFTAELSKFTGLDLEYHSTEDENSSGETASMDSSGEEVDDVKQLPSRVSVKDVNDLKLVGEKVFGSGGRQSETDQSNDQLNDGDEGESNSIDVELPSDCVYVTETDVGTDQDGNDESEVNQNQETNDDQPPQPGRPYRWSFFTWKKVKAFVFYSSFIALFVFIFFYIQPPSISDVINPVLCPEAFQIDSGVIQFNTREPAWRLHRGGGGSIFDTDIYYNNAFESSPHVFVSLAGIETSQQIGVDIMVNRPQLDYFTIRISIFDESYLDSITLSWFAVGTLCFDDPSLVGLSAIVDADINQLDSNDLGFGTEWLGDFTLPMNHEYFDDIEVFFSFRGLRFYYDDPFTEAHSIETNYEVVPHPLYNDSVSAETSFISMGHLRQIRYALLAFNSSFLRYNVFDRSSLAFGVNNTSNWELHLEDNFVFTKRIFFNFEFQRIPEVFVYITGIDTGNSPFAIKVEARHVDFLGFNVEITSPHDSVCNFISIEYFAYDEDLDRFDVLDFLLISIFIFFLTLALLFERFKGFFKGSINTSNEKYHSLPDNWFELIQDEETLAAKERYQPEEPPARVFRNDTWIGLLEAFESLKKQYTPGSRDTVEIVFWMVFAFVLFILLFFFYRDFLVATKFFHSLGSIYITLFILGLEHFLIILAFFSVSWPEHRVVKGFNDDNSNVAILIASHISAGRDPDMILNNCKNNFIKPPSREDLVELKKQKAIDFERTLRLASRSVGNGNVYVCHNANRPTPFPNDGTIEVIKKVKAWGRTVNYVYIPTGNKTFCLHYVNKNILAYRPEIEYVVIMDDDVMIPADMSWQTHRLAEDDVAGGVITIRADMNRPQCRNSWRRRSFLVAFQDMEYLLSGLLKLVQEKFGTCAYPHGAISIWKKKELNFVLECHNSAFHGEDAQMGFILRERCVTGKMKRLICLAATPALTQAPEDLFHLGEDLFGDHCIDEKSLFNQRVKSWDACAHRFFFKYLEHFVRYWNINTIILKPFYLYEMLTILRDYFHLLIILYFFLMADLAALGLIYFRVILLQYIVFFAFNYVKLRRRKDLQSPLIIVLLFPFYRLLLSLFRVFALFYNLFEYLPKKRMPSSEDPNLKVPYYHNYLSLNMHPEMWTKIWSMDEVKKGVEIHLPDDLPPLAGGPSMASLPNTTHSMANLPLVNTRSMANLHSGRIHAQRGSMANLPTVEQSINMASPSSSSASLASRRNFPNIAVPPMTPSEPETTATGSSLLSRTRSLKTLWSLEEYLE